MARATALIVLQTQKVSALGGIPLKQQAKNLLSLAAELTGDQEVDSVKASLEEMSSPPIYPPDISYKNLFSEAQKIFMAFQARSQEIDGVEIPELCRQLIEVSSKFNGRAGLADLQERLAGVGIAYILRSLK